MGSRRLIGDHHGYGSGEELDPENLRKDGLGLKYEGRDLTEEDDGKTLAEVSLVNKCKTIY